MGLGFLLISGFLSAFLLLLDKAGWRGIVWDIYGVSILEVKVEP